MNLGMKWIAAFVLAVGLSAGAHAQNSFTGLWKVRSTTGRPFQMLLADDGEALANLHQGMIGVWKEDGNGAVIRWRTGWTTKIVREGDHYVHTSYRPGTSSGRPAGRSGAEKESIDRPQAER